jgi:hypothetical protein
MGEERKAYDFIGGKAQRKETDAQMGGWDQNGS